MVLPQQSNSKGAFSSSGAGASSSEEMSFAVDSSSGASRVSSLGSSLGSSFFGFSSSSEFCGSMKRVLEKTGLLECQ